MHKTIVPWETSTEEITLLLANNTPLISEKCLEWKKSSLETKFALFEPIRKDPNRKINYEEMLGIGEVFGDTKPFSSCLIDFVTKEQAFELLKQCIYFATVGRKIPIDFDDKEMILQWAKNRLQFFK